ncbi:uncharacterized protein LOC118784364 [Megalops cyprinoides]|uniref:uncharacterized protein LOC118784364 n=1 Tax=Megalops cyprinoides TaxID=118141 RepID=UPI0018640139|nr:uncharacterized protein LOC118784364 [Megalops cyprinoides]
MFNSNVKESAKNELYITSYLPDTNVVVTVNKTPFKKELHMQGPKSETVDLPSDTEMHGTGKYSKTVIIGSNNYISIVSSNQKKNSVDTTLVYPVTEWGQQYYVFTPSSRGYPKEIAVFSGLDATSVSVELKCAVTFEGKAYKAGQTLTASLDASEVLYLESNEDCTGSRVVSDKPVGVMSGHACAWKNSKCQHAFEQLLPVERWGKSFIVPPLEYQVLQDAVLIFASQPTHVTYQFGPKSHTLELKANEWKEIPMSRNPPLVISASQPVQVLYFCNGGKFSDGSVFDPFIMNIVPTDNFCESHTLEGMKGFSNYALIVAKSKDVSGVHFDGKLPSFKWQPVAGTEYSWAHYTYEKGRGHHTLMHPSAPIGVYSVGTVDQNSYGAPAACGLLTCIHKGQYHPPGKPFWEDDACTSLCQCNPSTGLVTCQHAQCKAEEECKVVEDVRTCVAKAVAPKWTHPHTYITVYMLNLNVKESAKNELYITSYLPDTNVVVTVNKTPFKKELHMQGPKSETVDLPSDTEMHGTGKYSKTVIIGSNNYISIVSSNQKKNTVDTTLVYPVTEWGQQYYVFTPSSRGYPKEIAVFSGLDATSVSVELKCAVTFEGKAYKAGQTLTASLDASEVLYLESNEDCTGSRVVSDKPVGVMSGHACAWKNSKCQHAFEQLLPVERWGKSFIVPPLEYQVLQDAVLIFASQPTHVTYQFGPKSHTLELKANEWKEIPMSRNPPLVISASQPVQVLYFCNGGKFRDGSSFDPFIMNIVPTDNFCESHTLEGMEGFSNYALIVAKSKDVSGVHFDGKLPSFKWQPVAGTEYSWAHYTYEKGRGHHTLMHPSAPIGVYSVGTVDQNSYGAPAACGLLTCIHKGQYHPPGKPFWEDDACTSLCQCNPSTGLVTCQHAQCKAEEECKVVEDVRTCVAKAVAPKWTHPHTYITVYMLNLNVKESAKNELYITSYLPDTNVVVTVNKTPFKKELHMQGPKSETVDLPSDTEMHGTGKYSKTVIIGSNNYISIVSSNQKKNTVDTTLVYPVTEWGQQYYVFTPSSRGYPKEIAVFSGLDATSVSVELKCAVTFEGKAYKAGQTLTASLDASEVLYLESNEDCTGSRVVSDKPVGVMSGHACAWKNSKCQHAFEQLLPVERWGKSFIVPPLEYQVLQDAVLIFASQPTHVTYQFGPKSHTLELKANEWKEIPMSRNPPLVISASQPVQVLYFCNGGKFRDGSSFDPFIMNIVPTDNFCESHTLEGMEGFSNYALIVAKSKDVSGVHFDGKLPSFKWQPVAGTEYSWAHYTYEKGRGHHTLMHPSAPIGVYSVGTVDQNSYGAPAACGLLTCIHKGQYHPPGKPFWEDDACTSLCQCNPSTGLVTCQHAQCKAEEECKVVEDVRTCVAKAVAPKWTHPHTYITVYMLNLNVKESAKNELYITSYLPDTNVVVTVNKTPFKKELHMQGPKSETVDLPSDTEMHGTGKYSKTVIIGSNNYISIVSSNQKKNTVDTTLVYPVTEWGQQYYVFTPSSRGYPKEIAVFSGLDATSVSVELKCAVTFEGKAYKAGQTLTASLDASEVLYLESNEDCTGSRVVSDKPVGVMSGHACAWKNSKCQHAFEQLLPVERWGKSFIVPPLEYQVLQDAVLIFASQPTHVTYQFGPKSHTLELKANEWKEIPMSRNPPLVISASQPVQVLYFCNGGKFRDGSSFDPFIMNIVPTDNFCESHTLEGMEGFSNYALIVAKSKDVSGVHFDGKLPSFKWQPVAGTEYSWAHYTYEKGRE